MGKNSYLAGGGGGKRLRQASWWEEPVQDHWWVELGLGPPVGCKSPEVVVGSLIFRKPVLMI